MTTPQKYHQTLRKECGTAQIDLPQDGEAFRKRFAEALSNKYGKEAGETYLKEDMKQPADLTARERQLAHYRQLIEAAWSSATIQRPKWKNIEYGVLPTLELGAYTLTVPDHAGHLVIMDDTVFTLIYLVAKAVCGYMLEPMEKADSANVLKAADVETKLAGDQAGIDRFLEAIVAFRVWKCATWARPYFVDRVIMQYSAFMTDAAIVSQLVTGTLNALLDENQPQEKKGFIQRLFNRNKQPDSEPKPTFTRLEPITICDRVKVTRRVNNSPEFQSASLSISTQLTLGALNSQQDWTSTLAGLEMLIGLQRIMAEIDGVDADTIRDNYLLSRTMFMNIVPEEMHEQLLSLTDTVKALMEQMWEQSRQSYYRFAEQPRSPRSN